MNWNETWYNMPSIFFIEDGKSGSLWKRGLEGYSRVKLTPFRKLNLNSGKINKKTCMWKENQDQFKCVFFRILTVENAHQLETIRLCLTERISVFGLTLVRKGKRLKNKQRGKIKFWWTLQFLQLSCFWTEAQDY